jgi:KaiC/GvpD/RAD55 family RecA-like ATPase
MAEVITKEIKMLWNPYIALGKITYIVGNSDLGKTFMMLDIVAKVTNGESLPLGTACAPANVIFQSVEDDYEDTIKPRLEVLGADLKRVFQIDESKKQLTFLDEDRRLEQMIAEEDVKLLIFDSLQGYAGTSINSASKMRPLLSSLKEIAERTGCAIVVIGHVNKQHRIAGSADIRAVFRSVLMVGETGDYTRAIVHEKSNLAPKGVSIEYELHRDSGFKWLGECDATIDDILNGIPNNSRNKPESQLSKAKRFIQTALSDGNSVSTLDIIATAKDAGISEITLKRAKAELGVDKKMLNNHWHWWLPIDNESAENPEESEEVHEYKDNQKYQSGGLSMDI